MEDSLLNTSLVRHRPPDWRYRQAAADAAERRLRLPAAADLPQRTLTDCLRHRQDADHAAGRRAALAPPQFRRCHAALEIFADREVACQLEARVLARQTPREIATGLSLRVASSSFTRLVFLTCDNLSATASTSSNGPSSRSARGAPPRPRAIAPR